MYVVLVRSDLVGPAPVVQVCTGCEGIEAAIPHYSTLVFGPCWDHRPESQMAGSIFDISKIADIKRKGEERKFIITYGARS